MQTGRDGEEAGMGGHGSDGERRGTALQGVVKALAAVAVVAAVAKELRLPPERRTWHGTVAGFVPYDFRRPTLDRVRQRLWAPKAALLQPHVFGVGWTVNLGRLVALVRSRLGR